MSADIQADNEADIHVEIGATDTDMQELCLCISVNTDMHKKRNYL